MDALSGPRARVSRAQGQIAVLADSFKTVFEKHPYRIVVAEFDEETGSYNLRVAGGPTEPVDEWGFLIGEIAHNLRAALDNLTWQLALSKPITAPYDRTAFPIFLLGGVRSRRGKNSQRAFWHTNNAPRVLKDVPKRFWTPIASFQPYKRGNDGRLSPLFLLEELNNSDKHRLLTVVSTVPTGWRAAGVYGGMHIERGVTLHPNAKIGWVRDIPKDPPVQVIDLVTGKVRTLEKLEVEFDISPGVLFGDSCQALERLPVVATLRRIANEVSRVIDSFQNI